MGWMIVNDTIDDTFDVYGLVEGNHYQVCDRNGVAFEGICGPVSLNDGIVGRGHHWTATVEVKEKGWSIPIDLIAVFAIGNGQILLNADFSDYPTSTLVYDNMKRGLLFKNGRLVRDDFLYEVYRFEGY